MSQLLSLRDSLREVLGNMTADDPTLGPYVNYRQIANRLVQQAITAADPVPAVQVIVQILSVPDPANP